jgi:hypothetical protein
MSRELQELDVRLSSGPIAVFIPENESYLEGSRKEAVIEGSWLGYNVLGWILIPLGLIGALGLIGMTIYTMQIKPSDMEWTSAIFLTLACLGLSWWGRYMLIFGQQMRNLRENASHLIEGEVIASIPGPKGSTNYVWRAISPLSGKPISGSLMIGRLSPRFGRLEKGSKVAVLFLDDQTNAVL